VLDLEPLMALADGSATSDGLHGGAGNGSSASHRMKKRPARDGDRLAGASTGSCWQCQPVGLDPTMAQQPILPWHCVAQERWLLIGSALIDTGRLGGSGRLGTC
jgi:hypothetical protein